MDVADDDTAAVLKLVVPVADTLDTVDTVNNEDDDLADVPREVLAALPMPVIAAVHGWCIGAGLELIAGADLRLGFQPDRTYSFDATGARLA